MTRPRIAPLDPPYEPAVGHMLGKWMPPDSGIEPLRLFRTLAVHESLFGRMLPLGAGILGHGLLEPRLRELMILRTCARCGAEYEWGVHVTFFGNTVGLTGAEVDATVRAGAEDPVFSERERSVIRLADELHDTAAACDATFAELGRHFSPPQILELVIVAGWYHTISFAINTARVEREPWAARLPATGRWGAVALNKPPDPGNRGVRRTLLSAGHGGDATSSRIARRNAVSSDRQPWEYADGPTVGEEIPITSPPRPEERPGVPKPPPPEKDGERAEEVGSEVREVRAEDPELSPDTNERLTSELREVVGTDRAEVPADRPRATRGEHPRQHGAAAHVNINWLQFIRTAAIVLTFGAIIALITNDWWVLALAAGVHALGTMTVGLTIIRVTTTTEHPSPTVAAAMAEEGVGNPDERFSRMVEEFRSEPERGASEVISPGFNERQAPADTDTAGAAAEQSSAMTPTGQPSEPAGTGGTPDALVWATMVSLLVLSIALPPLTTGGWMWLVTAVMVPLLVGWAILQRVMITRRNQLHEAMQGRRPLIAIVVSTAIAVAAFCAVVAFAFQH